MTLLPAAWRREFHCTEADTISLIDALTERSVEVLPRGRPVEQAYAEGAESAWLEVARVDADSAAFRWQAKIEPRSGFDSK